MYPYLIKFQATSIIIKLNELKHYEAHDVEKCISNVFDNTFNLIRVTILYKILYLTIILMILAHLSHRVHVRF